MPKETRKKPGEGKRSRSGRGRGADVIDAEAVAYDAADEGAGVGEPIDLKSWFKGVAVLLFVAASVWGYLLTRNHVEKQVAFSRSGPKVELADRPAWMSDGVAAKILAVATPDVAHSAFDHALLVNTASLLRSHPDTAPWIKEVKSVRRAFDKGPGDLIEVDCEYRAPVALVAFQNYYWLIDGDGVLLPEQYTRADLRKVMFDKSGKPILRIIEGVGAPPPDSGLKWRGEDVAAAIEMVKLLHGKACADQVERINVSNHAGRVDRREAQIVLITKFNTQVRWGRPVNAKDFFVEVSPAQKLQYMEQLVQKFGRLDARHPAVDLRFDVVTFPTADYPAEGIQAGGSYNP